MAFLGINFGKLFGSKAGQAVQTFALSEADKVVAALKTTHIGSAIAADIAAVSNKKLSGSQKFAAVLANTIPLVVTYATGGGIKAAADDVSDIARALVQSVFNDTKSTGAGKIVGDFLKLFGLTK